MFRIIDSVYYYYTMVLDRIVNTYTSDSPARISDDRIQLFRTQHRWLI
jgi:hypothetical protein